MNRAKIKIGLILAVLLGTSASQASSKVLLEVVCDNTLAYQSNFQKKFFDSYNAATDSKSSRFVINSSASRDWGIVRYYPANKSALSSISAKGLIVKKGFHNLEERQAFIEGVMRNDRYTEVVALHRSKYGHWAVQVSNSGNNEGNLFHSFYLYECITLEDNIK